MGDFVKRQRLEAVVDLIHRYDIETQEELAAYLRGEGFAPGGGNGLECCGAGRPTLSCG